MVILKSMTPKIFCAGKLLLILHVYKSISVAYAFPGADLKERARMSPAQVVDSVTNLRGLMNRVQSISVPVLAAIDGVALGTALRA